jgi:hypothetical protein
VTIDQQKLNQEAIFEGRGTVAELVGAMDQIAILENKDKKRISSIRWIALAVFLVLVTAAAKFGAFPIVVGGLAGVGLLIYSVVLSKARIVHERVEFLRLILNMLSQDCGQRGRFQVLLRLRSKREKISEIPNPKNKGGKQRLFRDAWLSLNGRLGDGTSISTSCTDLIRQRTKKNPRGKIKTKERRLCLLRIQLDYDAARYGDAAVVAPKLENPFRLPAGVQLKAFSYTPQALAMKTIIQGNPLAAGLHAAAEALLLGAFRILNLARRRVLAGGGAK